MHIDDFPRDQRNIADRVIGSVIDLDHELDARTLLIGGYLSAQPLGVQDLTDEMLDAMVDELAAARAALAKNGVVDLGVKKVFRLSPDLWKPPTV